MRTTHIQSSTMSRLPLCDDAGTDPSDIMRESQEAYASCWECRSIAGLPDMVREELTGWGTFEELAILPPLFGAMVRRTTDVVKEYHSDLFHDAQWLRDHVTGACEFPFMVRTSGTNIGESAPIAMSIGAPGGILYRVSVHTLDGSESGYWVADFTEMWKED